MDEKGEFLRQLDESQQAALALLSQIDDAVMIYEDGQWRVKDVIAHVAVWETELLRSLHAYRRGGAYQIENYESVDDYNAFAASAKQFVPLADTLADWDATRRWLKIHLSAVSAEAFDDELMMPWGEEETVRELFKAVLSHAEEHIEDIRAKIALMDAP